MTIQLKIPKIACSACVNTVTKAVNSVDAKAKVAANTKTKMVSIETQAQEAEIIKALTEVGYPAA